MKAAVSDSDREKLITCAEEAEKKLIEEINAIGREKEEIETDIKTKLVKNNISWSSEIIVTTWLYMYSGFDRYQSFWRSLTTPVREAESAHIDPRPHGQEAGKSYQIKAAIMG